MREDDSPGSLRAANPEKFLTPERITSPLAVKIADELFMFFDHDLDPDYAGQGLRILITDRLGGVAEIRWGPADPGPGAVCSAHAECDTNLLWDRVLGARWPGAVEAAARERVSAIAKRLQALLDKIDRALPPESPDEARRATLKRRRSARTPTSRRKGLGSWTAVREIHVQRFWPNPENGLWGKCRLICGCLAECHLKHPTPRHQHRCKEEHE